MGIKRNFMGRMIHRPNYWGGPRVWSLNDEERAVYGLFKTFERFGVVRKVVCIKCDVNLLFCVDEVSVNESHEDFVARFKQK